MDKQTYSVAPGVKLVAGAPVPASREVTLTGDEAASDLKRGRIALKVAEEAQAYTVAEGVAFVNGARVPASREVMLTPTQARFDLEQGRIAPKGTAAAVEGVVEGDGTGTALPPIGDAAEERVDPGSGAAMVSVEMEPVHVRKAKA